MHANICQPDDTTTVPPGVGGTFNHKGATNVLFNPNSVTGRVTSTYRNFESNELYIKLDLGNAKEITLIVRDALSDQIENLLVQRRSRGETATLTLVYEPQTGEITSFRFFHDAKRAPGTSARRSFCLSAALHRDSAFFFFELHHFGA
ncbi:MAG: hypothetical protein HC828_01530 [Blastochloris sp.]|nr:hypothetical protein [Blastochloris sp.]